MRAVRGVAFVLAAGLAACGAAREAPRFSENVVRAGPATARAAAFRYHPRAAAPMVAGAELAGGRLLFAGKRGERWLYEPRTGALASALPAPEDLVAIARDGADGAWFVGRSGASYHARSPLGVFVDVNVPLSPLSRVSAGGRALLGVGRDQRLSRSDDEGRTWTPVGPDGTAFVDVALDARGRALALATPEALWESEDAGASFRLSQAAPSGVLSVAADASGVGIRVTSMLGSSRFGGGDGVAGPAQPSLEDVIRRGVSVPLGADASALAAGTAVFGGPGYVEARALGEGKREWQLLSGPLGAALTARPLLEAKGCAVVVLGSFERLVAFACFKAAPSLSQRAALYLSLDGGASFARVAPDFWAKPARFRLALGAGGSVVVSGACPPSVESQGCAPAGILYRRPVRTEHDKKSRPAVLAGGAHPPPSADVAEPESGFELAVSAVPALADGATVELAFDAAGRTAFALSGSTKGTSLTLFVSTDGGRSFEAHDLGELTRDQDLDAGLPFFPGADGTLSIVLGARRGSSSLLVLDAEGRVLSTGSPPERALLGASGLSALAIGSDSGRVFESLDGGVSWEPRGKLPFSLCPGDASCDVPIRCASAGCVIGDELTRVGFGASFEPPLDLYTPVAAGGENGIERRLRAPLSCVLAPAAWRALPGVRELPDADQAALGGTAWFAIAEDVKTGAVRAFHAKGGSRPRVESVELLPPLARPQQFAQSVTMQIEGAAALRYPVPGLGVTKLRDVEVVWDNLFENRVGRARVADAGPYTPGDFERGSGGVESARPELLSIAERGLYLRVHTRTRGDQPTLFLDGTSALSLPAVSWPSAIPRAGHAEMAHLGSEHVGLMLLSRGGAVARARRTTEGWAFDAAGVGLPDPEAFGVVQIVNLTYRQGQAALHVEELDERGQSARAWLFPLNAAGPVVGSASAAPTELDLASPPVACSAAERAGSARLVSRGYPGTRHPVVVSDAVEPPRALLTHDAVLYGTRANPCAAAFEVQPVPGGTPDPAMTESGIVLLDDLEHAWLMRRPREAGAEGPRIQYRSMSCHFDPNLELPQEILDASEALAPKR